MLDHNAGNVRYARWHNSAAISRLTPSETSTLQDGDPAPASHALTRQTAIGPRESTEKNRLLGARHATRRLPGEGDWYTTDRSARDMQANPPQRLPPRQHCSPRVAKQPDQTLSAHNSCPRHKHRSDTAEETVNTPQSALTERTRSPKSYNSISSAGHGHPSSSARRTLELPVKEAGHTYRFEEITSNSDQALAMQQAVSLKGCEEQRIIRVYTRELHTSMVRMRG